MKGSRAEKKCAQWPAHGPKIMSTSPHDGCSGVPVPAGMLFAALAAAAAPSDDINTRPVCQIKRAGARAAMAAALAAAVVASGEFRCRHLLAAGAAATGAGTVTAGPRGNQGNRATVIPKRPERASAPAARQPGEVMMYALKL